MRQILVYDLPTRVYHWLFAGFFVTAFAIANLVDDESIRFPLHMLAGMGMLFVVLLRFAWSLVGTHHARLADLDLNPAHLLAYLKGIVSGSGRRWIGHNPASSWAALAMVALALGLGVTGYLMASGVAGDVLEEAHELMANAFLGVVVLHLGGVLIHVLRHRDRLQSTMVTGRKQADAGEQAVVSSAPAAGMAFFLLTGLFVGYLQQNYDAKARTLEFLGSALPLGENEHGHGSGESDEDRHGHD